MNPFREQNPLVLGKILENQMFFMGSRVGLWKRSVERSQSEGHSRDLGNRRSVLAPDRNVAYVFLRWIGFSPIARESRDPMK